MNDFKDLADTDVGSPMKNHEISMNLRWGEYEGPWLSLVEPETGHQPDTKRWTKSWRL